MDKKPLTVEQSGGIAKIKDYGKPIFCMRCGHGGGTLVKVADDKYIHDKCRGSIGKRS